MIRKAEAFRRTIEQTRPPRPKQPPRARRDWPVDTAEPGVSASDRKAGLINTAERNRSERASRKAGWVLEGSTTGQPSRKSTRTSLNRQKPDTNLTLRAERRISAPTSRAARARARGA